MDMMLWYKHQRPFIVTEARLCDEWVDGCLVHWPQQEVAASKAFLYVDVATSNVPALAEALSQSGKSGVLSTRDPALLVGLSQFECRSFRLTLRVNQPKELDGLERCPYDAVEVVESMATHSLISRTHHSGKELFVRIHNANNKIRRQAIVGLIHEKVDLVIAETQHVLSMVKSALETGA